MQGSDCSRRRYKANLTLLPPAYVPRQSNITFENTFALLQLSKGHYISERGLIRATYFQVVEGVPWVVSPISVDFGP
jgi:hypothetical protein